MQAVIYVRPRAITDDAFTFVRSIRAHLTWGNAARVGLATMAIVALPLDMNHRILGPSPNWPLIAIEPVLLVSFMRCTLGSIR